MLNKYTFSIIIAISFFVLKVLENKIILNKDGKDGKDVKTTDNVTGKIQRSIKLILRDTLIVYIASVVAFFIYENIQSVTNDIKTPAVFVNEPDF